MGEEVRGRFPLERVQARVGLIAGEDEVAHHGIDLSLPSCAAEHAIVARPRLQMMALEVGLQRRAEIVRRDCLPDGADIVPLAFNREERRAAYRARVDAAVVHGEQAASEVRLLEHALDRLKIKLRRQVEHNVPPGPISSRKRIT